MKQFLFFAFLLTNIYAFSQNKSNEQYLIWPFSLQKCSECKGVGKVWLTKRNTLLNCKYCSNWTSFERTVATCPNCGNRQKAWYMINIKPQYFTCDLCKGAGKEMPYFEWKGIDYIISGIYPDRIGGSLRKRRVALYLALVEANIETKLLYPDWVDIHFVSENNLTNLYNFFVAHKLVSSNKATFFYQFACDVLPECQYCK